MNKSFPVAHEFVEFIPRELNERTLYVSMEYATATHKCLCGCGTEVVTPISPVGWKLTYDGENVSLSPSIGNWGLPCKSHYWITEGAVSWAGKMSPAEISAVRRHDNEDRQRHYNSSKEPVEAAPYSEAPPEITKTTKPKTKNNIFISWLNRWFK